MKNIRLSIRTRLTLLQTFIILFFLISSIFQINSLFRLRDINKVQIMFIGLENEFSQTESAIKDLFANQSLTAGIDETNIRVKKLVSGMDGLMADLRPSLSARQKKSLEKELEEVTSSFHEYALIMDDLTHRLKSSNGNNRTESQKILDFSASLADHAFQVKNEYFAFLLRDISDLGRRYSITPGNDILRRLSGRLEEAGKIISLPESAGILAGNEASRNALFSKLTDTKIIVSGMLDNNKQIFSQQEGTLMRLGQTSKSINHNLNLLEHEISSLQSEYFTGSFLAQLILLLLLTSLIILYIRNFSLSQISFLDQIGRYLREMVTGKLPDEVELGKDIEYSGMAKDLQVFVGDLQQKAIFAAEIGKDNLNSTYRPLSEDDILGNSLIEMQRSLHQAKLEEDKHRVEEEKRRWTNEGLARFSEIVRSGNNDLAQLVDHIIQNLVKYMVANQGGIFLLNDENGGKPFLELAASFAYNRKKYLSKKIQLGEGLLGTCAIEKETIMLTQIPDEYIEVTSGLGEAPPNCLILVPLKLESELLGVIEIASFSVFQPHEVDFLEKIAASIAATISSVKINTRTASLLVQSQQQARELAEKEEEMRQNMEELQATQEESARREMEITGILDAINHSSFVIEFDMEGRIIDANQKMLDLLSIKRDGLIGKRYGDIIELDPKSDVYHQLWTDMREGIHQSRIENVKNSHGKEIWLSVNFTPILDRTRKPYKILCIASDISESKSQEINLKKQATEIARKNMELESLTLAVDSSLIKCIYDSSAYILDGNENYEMSTGYSRKELIGKDNRMFLKPDEEEQFNRIWSEVMKNKVYTGVVKRTKPTGEELWLMSTFTPVRDEKGNIYKVYFLGQDITEKKLKYKLLEEANKEIERLKKQLKD